MNSATGTPATLIFFIPPHGLAPVLADMASAFGEGRKCVIARELTKVFLLTAHSIKAISHESGDSSGMQHAALARLCLLCQASASMQSTACEHYQLYKDTAV